MNRSLLTLYAIIVGTVITVGIALDAVWRAYSGEQTDDLQYEHYLKLIEIQLLSGSEPAYESRLRALEKQLDFRLSLLQLEDFASSEVAARLERGETIHTNDGDLGTSYRRLGSRPLVLALQYPLQESSQGGGQWLLTVLFYLAIGIAVSLWVWPLSRDLRTLENHIQALGDDGNLQGDVSLPANSAAFHLARAFNQMTLRIRQLMQSQKDMTHAISHELRTPMARMKFALEMASTERDPEAFGRQLQGIRGDVAELDSLVTELLDYATLEAAESGARFERGELRPLAEQLVRRVETMHPQLDFRIRDELSTSQVYGDWRLLERALSNLLGNAVRFAGNAVEIRLQNRSGEICICVDDDGPGVPPAERDNIFDSFVRLRQNDTSSGFGLGLAIVRNIADKHLGGVDVDDSPLGGARFRFYWPGE